MDRFTLTVNPIVIIDKKMNKALATRMHAFNAFRYFQLNIQRPSPDKAVEKKHKQTFPGDNDWQGHFKFAFILKKPNRSFRPNGRTVWYRHKFPEDPNPFWFMINDQNISWSKAIDIANQYEFSAITLNRKFHDLTYEDIEQAYDLASYKPR